MRTNNLIEMGRKEKEIIHSGHFMVSDFDAIEAQDEEEREVAKYLVEIPDLDGDKSGSEDESGVIKEKKEIGERKGKKVKLKHKHVIQYKSAASTAEPISIDGSLTKLFNAMDIAYKHKITSPKWNRFKGLKLRCKDKIRLNNVIWRCWHMQFILKKKMRVCQFALDVDMHNKPEAIVMEGKYWKRHLDTVTAEYKKWRIYYKNKFMGCENLHLPLNDEFLVTLDEMDWLRNPVDDLNSSMDFTDMLFSGLMSAPQHYAFPNPREIARTGNSDLLQPGLIQLQPNLDDFMDIEPLHEILMTGRGIQQILPSVPEEEFYTAEVEAAGLPPSTTNTPPSYSSSPPTSLDYSHHPHHHQARLTTTDGGLETPQHITAIDDDISSNFDRPNVYTNTTMADFASVMDVVSSSNTGGGDSHDTDSFSSYPSCISFVPPTPSSPHHAHTAPSQHALSHPPQINTPKVSLHRALSHPPQINTPEISHHHAVKSTLHHTLCHLPQNTAPEVHHDPLSLSPQHNIRDGKLHASSQSAHINTDGSHHALSASSLINTSNLSLQAASHPVQINTRDVPLHHQLSHSEINSRDVSHHTLSHSASVTHHKPPHHILPHAPPISAPNAFPQHTYQSSPPSSNLMFDTSQPASLANTATLSNGNSVGLYATQIVHQATVQSIQPSVQSIQPSQSTIQTSSHHSRNSARHHSRHHHHQQQPERQLIKQEPTRQLGRQRDRQSHHNQQHTNHNHQSQHHQPRLKPQPHSPHVLIIKSSSQQEFSSPPPAHTPTSQHSPNSPASSRLEASGFAVPKQYARRRSYSSGTAVSYESLSPGLQHLVPATSSTTSSSGASWAFQPTHVPTVVAPAPVRLIAPTSAAVTGFYTQIVAKDEPSEQLQAAIVSQSINSSQLVFDTTSTNNPNVKFSLVLPPGMCPPALIPLTSSQVCHTTPALIPLTTSQVSHTSRPISSLALANSIFSAPIMVDVTSTAPQQQLKLSTPTATQLSSCPTAPALFAPVAFSSPAVYSRPAADSSSGSSSSGGGTNSGASKKRQALTNLSSLPNVTLAPVTPSSLKTIRQAQLFFTSPGAVSLPGLGSGAAAAYSPPHRGGPPSPLTGTSKAFRPKSDNERVQYREHRRVCHINAEKKRRCSIKSNFEMLHTLIPSINATSSSKMSKAALLHKGADHIQQLKGDRAQLSDKVERVKREMENLASQISTAQSQLPATGAPMSHSSHNQLQQMYREYVKERTMQSWKFYIFSMIGETLLKSYNENVSTACVEDLSRSSLAWLDQHCSLNLLRPVVSSTMLQLSTSTSVLATPQNLPEDIYHLITKQEDTRGNNSGSSTNSSRSNSLVRQ